MVDTLGREVMVVKQIELDETGWPQHGVDTRISSGSEARGTEEFSCATSHAAGLRAQLMVQP